MAIASTMEKPRWAMPPAMHAGQLLVAPGGAAGDVGRPRGVRQLAEVEGGLDVAVHARRRLVAEVRGGAHLAAGHAVDGVVEDERGEVDVAPRRVDEVVAADGGAVAVAHGDDHVQRRVGRLDARRHRQRAAVRGVHRRVVEVGADAAAAADAGDDDDLLGVELEAEDGVDERPGDRAVGAARAPERLGRAQVRLDLRRRVRPDARQLGVAGRRRLEPLLVDQGAHASSQRW